MKYKKLFGALLVASTLILGACGGGNNSGSASGGGKSSGKSGGSTTSRSSVPPTPSIECDSFDLEKTGDNVFLVVKGSARAITETSVKFAFGLERYSSSSGGGQVAPAGDEGEGEGEGETSSSEAPAEPENNFVYGKETPADADYNVDVAIENNAFSAKLNLTAISANLLGGEKYTVYAGAKGYTYAAIEGDATTKVLQDVDYKYYVRSDQEAGNAPKLVVDALGPVRIEKASIARDLYGRTGIFVKIGGALRESLTADQLNAFTSYVNFQKLPNTSTRVQKEGAQQEGNPYYFYVVEGNEAFIVINIDFVVADNATSGDYNTHLNIKENKQENCVSTGIIDTTDAPFDAGNGKTIAVYSHPGEHTEANIWGNVGLRVTIPEADAGE